MDHLEKVQLLNEVQEIRALILKLNQTTGTGLESSAAGGGGGLGGSGTRGKRVLDLF
jgi:hypothetical protein